MRGNKRKPNILEIIAILMMVVALVYFLGTSIFMIIGLAWLLIRFLIHHYVFTLSGIFVCLILFHCIYCIKQIRRESMTADQAERSVGRKTFLILHCALDIICLISVIAVALTVIIPSTGTTSRQPAGIQTAHEYLTEPKFGINLDRTVYVSNSGHKIHLHSDCSGMKNYDVMTYEEACEAGYSHCSRCFG